MNANELIDKLGGTTKVASLLGIRPPSVSEWRSTNRIPRVSLIFLAPIAERLGILTRQELLPLDYFRIWPDLPAPEITQDPVPAIPEELKAVLPQLKNCGRLKDDRAIAQFLNLPPATRSEVFNTTPPNQLITEAICLKAKQALARGPQ